MDANICRAAYLLRLQLSFWNGGGVGEATGGNNFPFTHHYTAPYGFGGRYLTSNEQTADGARLALRSTERVYLVVKVMSCQSDDEVEI